MALHTKIGPIPFADGEYVFDVGPLGIRLELEEKCGGIGLLGIHRRLQTDCLIMDYRETIRLGLMGGGMKPLDALKLVKRYVEARPAQESVPLAMMILMAGLVGVEEEKKDDPPLGKQQAETALTGTKPVSPSADQPLYQYGAAIGLSPRQVDELTHWEFIQCLKGWSDVHSGTGAAKPEPPTSAEFDRLLEAHAERAASRAVH
jgi:hypothetical protein